jgi:hypothetical protein
VSAGLDPRPPFPGLRPFTFEETDRFFGREECIDGLVDLLSRQHFLAVLGSSGSGKSSLVKTALLDALERGLMAQAGSRWRIVVFRPGDEPLRNLARALLESDDEQPSEDDVSALRTFLARGPRSLVEWCEDGHLGARENLLLLVDQFEEVFRYSEYSEREQAEAFVGLLLESSNLKAGAPIYVVLTMRSEYLGPCALIEGLAERMNTAQFLTPRMTRQQCRSAIEGPASVCEIAIEPALVNQMLNELANFAPWEAHDGSATANQLDRLARRADQLPLLQHALNRLWQRATPATNGSQPGPKPLLTLADYEMIGGLQGALARHADEILASLGPEREPVAESVFRALTTGTSVADAVRRPTLFKDLVAISGAAEAEVRAVLDAFRAPGCNFILPDGRAPLRGSDRIEISHESVIRQWPRLSAWLEKEAYDVQQWRRLCDWAELERTGKSGLLDGALLQNFLDWRKQANPNPIWAARYGPPKAFDDAVSLLDRSRAAVSARRTRKGLQIAAAAVVAIGLVGGLYEGFEYVQSRAQSRASESIEAARQAYELKLRRETEQVDADVRQNAAKTISDNTMSAANLRAIFDKAAVGYQLASGKKESGADHMAHLNHIIELFEEVYSTLPASAGAKPFAVFDTMSQALPPDEAQQILVTLGHLGIEYVGKARYDLARAAYNQAFDTASRVDKTLAQFQDTLADMISSLQDTADSLPESANPAKDGLYDFGIDYLKKIDPRDQSLNAKTIRADIQGSKMDLYIVQRNVQRIRQMYNTALQTYQDVRRRSDDKTSIDIKIADLKNRYDNRNK